MLPVDVNDAYKKEYRFDNVRWRKFLADFDGKLEKSCYKLFSDLPGIDEKKDVILQLNEIVHSSYQETLPQNEMPEHLVQNLMNIYGRTYEEVWNYVNAYNDTRKHIIKDYIGIAGMEQLFSSYYFNLEWYLHITPNFCKGEGSLYRDHFLHQCKNAWMGYVYLHDYKWIKRCLKWFETNNSKIIAKQANEAVAQETLLRLMEDQKIPGHPLRSILDIYITAMRKGKVKEEGEENLSSEVKNRFDITSWPQLSYNGRNRHNNKEIIETQYYILLEKLIATELIQTTWFIAALLHDIGYPMKHVVDLEELMMCFIPSMSWSGVQLDETFNLLSMEHKNSLLFKLIHEKDLRDEYRECDHGTISALLMLHHFYIQGTVHSFSPLQRFAIDWAAVCIQQHTHKFQKSSLDKKDKYIIDLFADNPLGNLLRHIDDLQEYGRMYFEISRNHALRFCNICKYPFVKVNTKHNHESIINQMTYADRSVFQPYASQESDYSIVSKYSCACHNNINGINADEQYSVERYHVFPYRRINLIELCRQVRISTLYAEPDTSNKTTAYIIDVCYDPWSMLMMLPVNPRFVLYRISSINEIKRSLKYQFLPRQFIRFFICINPILLKTDILFRYMDKYGNNEWKQLKANALNLLNSEQRHFKSELSKIYRKALRFVDKIVQKEFADVEDIMNIYHKYCSQHECENAKPPSIIANNSYSNKDTQIERKAIIAYRMHLALEYIYIPVLCLFLLCEESKIEIWGTEIDHNVGTSQVNSLKSWYYSRIQELRVFSQIVEQDGYKYNVNEDVCAFLEEIWRARDDIKYRFTAKNEVEAYQNILPNAYYHSYEFCTDSKKAAKNDEKGIILQEQFITRVIRYADRENYKPNLLFSRDDSNFLHSSFYAFDFYSDLGFYKLLYQRIMDKEKDEDLKMR